MTAAVVILTRDLKPLNIAFDIVSVGDTSMIQEGFHVIKIWLMLRFCSGRKP
jgi:hypothetical protein